MSNEPKMKKVTRTFPPLAGFWDPTKGKAEGVLTGAVTGENPFYVMRLTKETAVTDKEAGELTAKPGQYIGVSGSAGLSDLAGYMNHLVIVERGAEKKTSKTGRQYWPFEIMASEAPVQEREKATTGGDDNIPF